MASSAALAAPTTRSTSSSTSAPASASASTAAPDSTSANILETLPARPPTPPREANHDVVVSLKSLLGRSQSSDPRHSLQTPPTANSSPASSDITRSGAGSSRLRKKVEWSAHTEYKEASEYRKEDRAAKSSPASATSKPVKGILKPSPSHNLLTSSLSNDLDGPAGPSNITEMLDSTIKQLAGTDRDSKLDAYMMLSRALKASNNLPDRVALQDKMSLFMQFIQRDTTSKTENGVLDTSLINHALNLLATFLHFPAIASTLTSDFGVFIMDHSIRSFEDVTVPKDIVRHLMQVVAFQNFSIKVMTADRVGRLITALHNVENHLKGKSIVMSRIHIYKRLVKQSRNHMSSHPDWLKDMFTDMLSNIKDIRAQAIALGLEAGFSLRSEKQLIRKTAEIFQTTNEEESYIVFYIKKLQEMIKERQSSSSVPQIWSVIMLFLRFPLEKWHYYGDWLKLAQSAFNTTDGLTKQEANYAWNRYVYLSFLESKVSPKSLGTLSQPLLSQLRRKSNPKQPEETARLRRVVIGGICNLYYYAFAPNTDRCPLDTVWDITVQPVMAQLTTLDNKPDVAGDGMMQAARMLVSLLDVSTPRVWRQDRIIDTPPVKADELPPIDSKWVRRNCDKVLQAVGPILEHRFLDMADKDSLIYRLWQSLVGSIAAASAKDIKVSEDTARFFACIFGLLSAIWNKGTDEVLCPKLLTSMRNVVTVLVGGLGMLPFTEKKLSMTVANTFEPICTPSHRPDRPDESRGVVRVPLHHLFSLLSTIPPGGTDNADLSDFFQGVFEPFFNGRTAKARAELGRELLHLIPRNSLSPFGPWLLAAHNMSLSLDQTLSVSAPSPTGLLLGPGYRDAVSLLERGLSSHPNLPSQDWFSLYNLVSEHVVQEVGDAGRALIIIEPLAKLIVESISLNGVKPSATSSEATCVLLQEAKLPRDRQALDTARRRLWGTPAPTLRGGLFDPFDNLYKLSNQTLAFFYDKFEEFDAAKDVAAFFESQEAFMVKCFPQALVKTLSQLQTGLCVWIQDEKAQLKLGDDSSISKTLRHLWDRVCVELGAHGRLEKKELDQIEPLLAAAFKSKHRFIVSKTAEAWNKIVKDEESVQCSDSLKTVLSSLRSKVDIHLPGVEESVGDFGAQMSSFVGPPEDISFIVLSSTSTHHDAPQPPRPLASASLVNSRGPMTRKRRLESTPEVVRAKPTKRTSTPRLRHDNSQIQFAPITSSSPVHAESQHLTEHQKEVRERQRDNATIYSDRRSSPPTHAQDVSATHVDTTADAGVLDLPAATPERNTSYEDLISSTPTPRRGQVLQMDEDNDPPSSPPIPRPYPLLSEIQSRSRASSSLDNWEFSSPPGSPVPSHQQVAQDAEPSHLVLTDDSTQNKANIVNERKRRAADETGPEDIIPSSVVEDELPANPSQKESKQERPSAPSPLITRKRRLRQRAPATPPQKRSHVPTTRKSEQTPKSTDDVFVDARSAVKSSSPVQPIEEDVKDMSFALSEGDESQMMKLVVEVESKHDSKPLRKVQTTRSSKKAAKEHDLAASITAHTDSPSPPQPAPRRSSKRFAPTALLDLVEIKDSDNANTGVSKRGRKRAGSTMVDDREKKRRSVERETTSQAKETEPMMIEKDQTPPAPQKANAKIRRAARRATRMETRRSSRGQPTETVEDDTVKDTTKAVQGDDGGDTDEELMSQLVAESNAASQGPSQPESEVEDNVERAEEEPQEEEAAVAEDESEQEKNEEALVIMGALRDGLERLRSVALSRDEVYKMEDMLMDMKRELFEAERRGRV